MGMTETQKSTLIGMLKDDTKVYIMDLKNEIPFLLAGDKNINKDEDMKLNSCTDEA